MRPAAGSPPVVWRVEPGLTSYQDAVALMEARVDAIAKGEADELIWLVEHPPLYTGGTSAKADDLLDARFEVHASGRGGQYTYHGPGQRVVYVMLDLSRRRRDVRLFVHALETWIIDALAAFDVESFVRDGRVGVWVARPDKPNGAFGDPAEDKIAAIGVRVRRWATFHGLAINVSPDLSHFSGIVPCGLAQAHLGVTSLRDLGRSADTTDLDAALRRAFVTQFGPIAS
jgi:lipoyl(octanoyl) transferase